LSQDDDREALQLAARQHEATLHAAKQAVQERNRAGHNATTVMRELESRMAAVIAENQELAAVGPVHNLNPVDPQLERRPVSTLEAVEMETWFQGLRFTNGATCAATPRSSRAR
jgi:hypothetical protein